MQIDIENLTKKFGEVFAVDDLSLDIKDGEFVAFLGPSGCGKTTTLLILAGIYKPSGGHVRFNGQVVNRMAPRDRNIGMVFQSYALYPHMTVFGNIAYPLKLQHVPKAQQEEQVRAVAEMMGIGQLLDRRPGQLSGGQQQRVALGRALVKEPDVLLFDEPLSNLDARLRLSMRGEIRALQKRLGITSVYVTHDQIEALTMADRIAVMNEAQLEAFDTPENLYDQPRTLFIAGFVGNPPMNILPVEVMREGEQVCLKSASFSLVCSGERALKAVQHGRNLTMGIRPEDITLVENAESDSLSGEVFVVEPLGREDMLDVHVGDSSLLLLVDNKRRIRIGDTVHLRLNPDRMQFFDPQTEKSILWN
jgi:inositol-phosphate transport system ATP-binding protein